MPDAAEKCIRCRWRPPGWLPTLCGRCGSDIAWAWFVFQDRMPGACEERVGNIVFKNYCNRLQRESRKAWKRHGL